MRASRCEALHSFLIHPQYFHDKEGVTQQVLVGGNRVTTASSSNTKNGIRISNFLTLMKTLPAALKIVLTEF